MIYIKTPTEIAGIKKACAIYTALRAECIQRNLTGMTLKAIDLFTKKFIEAQGAKCAFANYRGFPGYNCLSRNETIIHGVADDNVFGRRDKLTLDIGIALNGYICDAAFTLLGPDASDAYHAIDKVTLGALYAGAAVAGPGVHTGDVSVAIQNFVQSQGYSLLRDYGGHGCGLKIHEDPLILNYGSPKTGPILKPGMVICLEPMTLQGPAGAHLGPDGWSVISDLPQPVCHWEHMVLITPTGREILTA